MLKSQRQSHTKISVSRGFYTFSNVIHDLHLCTLSTSINMTHKQLDFVSFLACWSRISCFKLAIFLCTFCDQEFYKKKDVDIWIKWEIWVLSSVHCRASYKRCWWNWPCCYCYRYFWFLPLFSRFLLIIQLIWGVFVD